MNIDSSYFCSGSRQIYNANAGVNEQRQNFAVNSAIESFIKQYSPKFLVKVFGKDIADKILETEKESADETIKSLFDGIAEAMAEYVLFHILRDTAERMTIDGVVILKNANTHVSSAVQQANAWNRMVDDLREFYASHQQIRANQDLLTKITPCWI